MKIREMAKDSAIYGASNAVNAAIGAVGFLLLTRAIAPAEYGTLALVVSLSGIFVTLGTLSISNGMSYYFFAAEKEEIGSGNRILSSGFAVGVASALALAVVVGLFLGPVTGFALIAPSLLLPAILFSYLEAVSGILQDIRRLRFEPIKFTVVSFTRSSLAVGLGLSMVYFLDAGAAGYLWGAVLGSALACSFGFYFARRDLNRKPEREPARAAAAYSWPTALAGLATWVAASSGLWILAVSLSDESLGQYATALQFAMPLSLVVASVIMAWWPTLLREWNRGGSVDTAVGEFSLYWSSLLVALVLVIIPMANWFVKLAIPESYWLSLTVLPTLLLAAALTGVHGFTSVGLSLARRTRTLATVAWVCTLLGVAFSLLLVGTLGWWAPAISSVGVQAALSIGYRVWGQRAFPIRIPLAHLIQIWGFGALGATLCTLATDPRSDALSIELVPGALLPFLGVLAVTAHYRWRRPEAKGIEEAILERNQGTDRGN